MKTPSLRYSLVLFVVFLLGIICTLFIVRLFLSHAESSTPKDLLHRLDGAGDKEKLDSILDARNQMGVTAYSLVPNGNGTFLLTVNLPTFFTQTPDEQSLFIERMHSMSEKHTTYDLLVNISGKESIDLYRADALLFQYTWQRHLDIEFYDLPSNYHELLDANVWHIRPNTNFSLRIHGPAFPYRFSLTAFLLHAKKMTERNLYSKEDISEKLDSFTFEVKESSGIDFDLSKEWEEALKYFPARYIVTDHVKIRQQKWGMDDTLEWGKKVETFFQGSPIENMDIRGVGKKENGKIILYGF